MDVLSELVPEKREEIERRFCDIMRYDPNMPASSPGKYASNVASLKKRAEAAGSTYAVSGRKTAYYKTKAVAAQ